MTFEIKVRGARPAFFLAGHQCLECGYEWELSLKTREEHELPLTCPDCIAYAEEIKPASPDYDPNHTHTICSLTMSGSPVTIVRGNHDFAERQNERLWRRSNNHFKREGKEEAYEKEKVIYRKEGWLK